LLKVRVLERGWRKKGEIQSEVPLEIVNNARAATNEIENGERTESTHRNTNGNSGPKTKHNIIVELGVKCALFIAYGVLTNDQ